MLYSKRFVNEKKPRKPLKTIERASAKPQLKNLCFILKAKVSQTFNSPLMPDTSLFQCLRHQQPTKPPKYQTTLLRQAIPRTSTADLKWAPQQEKLRLEFMTSSETRFTMSIPLHYPGSKMLQTTEQIIPREPGR